jgi:hypothetical protein
MERWRPRQDVLPFPVLAGCLCGRIRENHAVETANAEKTAGPSQTLLNGLNEESTVRHSPRQTVDSAPRRTVEKPPTVTNGV